MIMFKNADAVAVIVAQLIGHNPRLTEGIDDNGIPFVQATGSKLPTDAEIAAKDLLEYINPISAVVDVAQACETMIYVIEDQLNLPRRTISREDLVATLREHIVTSRLADIEADIKFDEDEE